MFSDRYHLTASALTRVCPLMKGLMLWITSFNCCRVSLLLLLLNAFLKVKTVYSQVDSTISGASQCSASSSSTPPTSTYSTSNFLGVEGPFSNEVGPSRVVWGNCHLLGYVGAFSQLLKCFSKLLARLLVLLQWWHFSFLIWGSQWWCLSTALFEKNLVHFLHLCLVLSIKHSIDCSISTILHQLLSIKLLLQCNTDLILKKKNHL